MAKKLLFILLLCSYATAVGAQSMLWGKKGGSADAASQTGNEEVKDMATDANGNIYILSDVGEGGINVDNVPYSVSLQGFKDVMLASFTCNGALRWIKLIGSTSAELPLGLVVDGDGVYCGIYSAMGGAGSYNCKIDNDATILQTDQSLFLIKYDTGGNYHWHRALQADTVTGKMDFLTIILDMDIDEKGEVNLLCNLPRGLYGGPGGFSAQADVGVYLLRYNASGAFMGGVQLDMKYSGTMILRQTSLRINRRNGNFYIGGNWHSATDEVTIASTRLTGGSFIACFDKAGKNLWFHENKGTPTGLGIAYEFSIDSQSNIYVTGGVRDSTASFNGYRFHLPGPRSFRPIVMKLDSMGNVLWAIASNPTRSSAGGIATALRNSGEIAVVGNFIGELSFPGYPAKFDNPPNTSFIPFFMRISSHTGKILWMDTIDRAGGYAQSVKIMSDGRDNIIMGGTFKHIIRVNGQTITATPGGFADWWIAKYGYNCNCKEIPQSNFAWQRNGGAGVNFSYTGTAYNSIEWDFGDGHTSTDANPSHTYTGNGMQTACVTVRNSCGDHTTCYNLPLWPLGIAEAGAGQIAVYPNPAGHQITIEGIVPGTRMQLLNILGQQVYTRVAGSPKETISTAGLVPGSYLLHLSNSQGQKQSFRIEKN